MDGSLKGFETGNSRCIEQNNVSANGNHRPLAGGSRYYHESKPHRHGCNGIWQTWYTRLVEREPHRTRHTRIFSPALVHLLARKT